MITTKRSLLTTNIVWLYGLQGLNYLIPMVMIPYLVRALGVQQYGLIAFAQALCQYFVLATDYGFNFSATRAIAKISHDKAAVSRVFWTVMCIKVMLLAIGVAVLGVIVECFPQFHSSTSVYFVSYIGVVGSALFPIWLFQGVERMKSISVITGVGKLISAALVVIFVRRPSDTILAAFLLSLGFLFAGVIGVFVALRHHISKFIVPSFSEIFAALHEGKHLFVTTASISLFSNTNTFMVGMIAGVEQAGYFSLADKLIRAISGVIAPVIQAAYPHMIRLIAESRILAIRFVQKLLWGTLGGGVLAGLGMFLLAKPVAHAAFSANPDKVINLLKGLSLFPLLAAINYTLGVLVVIPFGFDKSQSRLLFSMGVLNVLLGLVLIERFGALGGIISMTIIECLQIAGSGLILKKGGLNIFATTL